LRTVHLFVPCLVEDVFPEIGEATARVLSRAGVEVVYPPGQTCCGQMHYKLGRKDLVRPLAKRFLDLFDEAGAVVAPSGSCVNMVRQYPGLFTEDSPLRRRAEAMAAKTFELCDFLVNELGAADLGARFPAKAAYHDSCQVGRALGLHREPRLLLEHVRGLTLVELARPERCCGFGGAFSLKFPDVSEAILEEKLDDILETGAEVVTTAEVSCLLNISSALKKAGHNIRALHVAQILDMEDA
jgi:L-lactate dehydrogenase complex protein LldE